MNLGRSRLVLAPGLTRSSPAQRLGTAAAGLAALLVALLAGAVAGHAWWPQQPEAARPDNGRPLEQDPMQKLKTELATTLLQVRVAEARSSELERQIDTLNQSLHACQEEVTFFRKAVNSKR